ncbi:MAG: glycosyltransferase family 2 protein [Alphaproteobacteria bacterium]|nr:glycosyltransferase family 2 protein [Alphaproteobacteria bacterium]
MDQPHDKPQDTSVPAPVDAPAAAARPALSVVIPIHNEEESIPPLCEQLFPVLDGLGKPFEVIAVNDGSSDGSFKALAAAAARRPELKIVDFRRNYGQTAAMMAGFDHATGDVIVSLDADLQNDPSDIPTLLDKLDEGYDVVSGWRKNRTDAAIRRNFVSRVANRMISVVSGVRLNDYGCTLKAYRRDVIDGVRLYGEMHRFLPIYVHWMGARITEMPVKHHPRQFGHSKYGLRRTFKVILDLMVVKFLENHFVNPIYLFGGFGVLFILLSAVFLAYMFYLKFVEGISFILTPLPVLSAVIFLAGIMSLMMGLLAEMLVRTYFESQHRPAYLVRRKVNFDEAA